ncbi:hypothetical protein SUGI_0604650 [Cryptomeria japonica]|nr:hypothetical protein SUGI_0604650 [Cryptomeria japonica]
MGSDHNPIVLEWFNRLVNNQIPFCYEITWTTHPEFRDCISEWWSTSIQGTRMYRISQKLDLIKKNVKG